MASTRIATTLSRDLQPLGTAGQTAVGAWSALYALLSRRLSPRHARLLAEPVVNPARGETDWYSEGEGQVVPLTDLPPAAQQQVRAELERLTGDIAELAESLRGSGKAEDRFLAEMLDLARQLPDESAVRVQGGQPVLIAWGHAHAGPSAVPVVLTGRKRRLPVPMTILPPPAAGLVGQRPRSWLAWWIATLLALLVLLAVLALALRDPFGWKVFGAVQCAAPSSELALRDRLKTEAGREADLRAQLAQIARDAGQRRAQCPPVQPPAPPPPPPPSSDEQRAQQRGAHSGKLQIILAWDDRNDLDLHVSCPDGRQQVYFDSRHACGGELDVDANGDARTATATPVENVTFATPGPGRYRVMVDAYAMRVSQESAWRVTVKREGSPDQVFRGTISLGQRMRPVTVVEVEAP